MKKVYVFYLKGDKSPYAYTIDTEYRNLFMIQRDMSQFYLKKIDMEKYEFMIFMNSYHNNQLVKDYLYDGTNDIEIISTVEESAKLSESCDYIRNTIYSLEKNLRKIPFKKKYLTSILKITNEINRHDKNNPTLRVDTFTLFYHLFKHTFTKVTQNNEEGEF